MHRSHSRKLFKALRLQNSENTAELISIGHGVSITDNWWIQRDDENLEYCELKKYNEQIADIALLGGSDSDERNTEGAPGFDYNLGLIASGVPRINKSTGNVFTKSLLSNETCRRILKESIPDKQKITIAVESATAGVKSTLVLNDLNYSLIENYIKDTFDYISENIY